MNIVQNYLNVNENMMDRFIRLLIGLVLFQLAFFWLAGVSQGLAYLVSGVMVITAIIGFCPLYKVVGVSTHRGETYGLSKIWVITGLAVLTITLIGGSYSSTFFSRKFFLEDFNQMNAYYKQALFQTGQANREAAIQNYDQLLIEYDLFQNKYTAFQPYALRSDPQFKTDLDQIAQIIEAASINVHSGDLQQAHLTLEDVRPIFQGIFKRSDFSLLAVALVDFHDVMEVVLDAANEGDAAGVLTAYTEADAKLQAIEAEANDPEIQTIRANLEVLRSSAQNNHPEAFSAQASDLKSSFVKVYLTRG